MSSRANVSEFLTRRRPKIHAAFDAWTNAMNADSTSHAPTDVTSAYLTGTNLGDVRSVGSSSVFLDRSRASAEAPTVLVLGSHDATRLVENNPAGEPTIRHDATVAPGVGSLFGPTCAFVEGAKASLEAGLEEPLNLRVLSVGPGDRAESCLADVGMDGIDAIYATHAVAWDLGHPTITTGARGCLTVKVAVDGGQAVNDEVFAGAVRNPLGALVQLLGSIRDERGRIAIPGFYERAVMPSEEDRQALRNGGFDPNAWLAGMSLSRPTGSLSALERATLWPVVSVLDVSLTDRNLITTSAGATATLAFYLVPDQRPVQIEAAVRSWVADGIPSNLASSVSVLSMARPYRSDESSPAVAAQIAAARRLSSQAPTLIPGGGTAGAGEITYLTGAPVAFAGLTAPSHGWGTQAEILPWPLFERGVHLAAETCLGLASKRRSS